MKIKTRTALVALFSVILFLIIKEYIKMPIVNIEITGLILTITSILFGFLAGFFISELWTRYSELRNLQGTYSSSGISMIQAAKNFFKNKKFKEEFKKSTEEGLVATEIAEWYEDFNIPYLKKISNSFKHIKVKNEKDSDYLQNLLNNYNNFLDSAIKSDILGKERLFPSEWFVMISLSIIIALSILFLDIPNFFYRLITVIFPAIIVITLLFIYDLNTLLWSKEIVSLEPNASIFDALEVQRFYLKEKRKFLSPNIKNYRIEDDLRDNLKELYEHILKERKSI